MPSTTLLARQAPPMNELTMGPPYPATTAALGGLPTVGLDVPICAVFLVLFIGGAISHMTIFQVNMKRGHKFILSGMMFGFCMSRLVTMVLRIVWAVYPHNVRMAIAANVFVAAGVVLLFIINLLFAQRIIRASHPNSGWHPILHYSFMAIYVIIVLSLIALITSVIQANYTLNHNTKRIDHIIQLYGGTFYAFVSFLPILLVIGGLVIPRKTRVEKFGSGRFRHKIAILLLASALLCLGASFRVGVNYAGGNRPRDDPAGYQSKACFYIFNFTVEIITIYLYVIVRVDKRFWVPDKSHGPGDYSRKPEDGGEEKEREESREGMHITSEEETFDDMSPEDLARSDREKGGVVDEEKGVVVEEEKGAVADEEKGVVVEEEKGVVVEEEKGVVVEEEKGAVPDEEKGIVQDGKKGIPADEEPKHEQAPATVPVGLAPQTPPTPPRTPPPVSHQPEERVIEMSRD